MFKLDRSQLSSAANKDATVNALYAAIYTEFRGASTNPKYKHLTNLERIDKVNEFVDEWLSKRGLE